MINEEKHAHETSTLLSAADVFHDYDLVYGTWSVVRLFAFSFNFQANLNFFFVPFHCKTEEAPYKQKYTQFSF